MALLKYHLSKTNPQLLLPGPNAPERERIHEYRINLPLVRGPEVFGTLISDNLRQMEKSSFRGKNSLKIKMQT